MSVDGSHIDVDATCPCAAFSSTWAAASSPTAGTSAAGCSASPPWLWTTTISTCGLRTAHPARRSSPVRCSARCARCERWSAWPTPSKACPPTGPSSPLLDGTLAFWDLQRGQYPRHVADTLIGERLSHALARLREASTDRASSGGGRLHPQAPHHRGDRRRAPDALQPGRRRLQPPLHRPPFPVRSLRRRRRLRRPGAVRARAGTGDTARPCTGPATWQPASPWDWPPARSGATSTT